jgi:hypothetical protein
MPSAVLASAAVVDPVPPAEIGRAALRSVTMSSMVELYLLDSMTVLGTAVVPAGFE